MRRITSVFGGAEARYPTNVKVARLRTIQGVVGEFIKFDTEEMRCVDPGEAHGMTPVLPFERSELI